MIDNYAWFSIVCRTIALVIYGVVMYFQLEQIRMSKKLLTLKWTLFSLTVVALLANLLSLAVNLFRQADGNLVADIRHFAMVVNAIFVLFNATCWLLIYLRDRE